MPHHDLDYWSFLTIMTHHIGISWVKRMQSLQKLDHLDRKILTVLQQDAALSQRAVAEAVGLSQNACWRRIARMEADGTIRARRVELDRTRVGASLVVFAMVRTRHHSTDWLKSFRAHVTTIPEVIDFYRIGGDYDYLLKVAAGDMADYDRIYQRLISKVELETVTSFFAMEAILEQRPLPL
jgi:Lrp/AsnC family transcriptional regulator